jgi:hypothetical protein
LNQAKVKPWPPNEHDCLGVFQDQKEILRVPKLTEKSALCLYLV